MAVIKTKTFHEAWNCDGCGTEGLSAYDCKQCPNDGAPLDDELVYRTRRVVENYKFKGHDVHCAHCQTRNEKRFSCRNCGASLTDGDDKRVEKFTYKSDSDGRPKSKHNSQRRASDRRSQAVKRSSVIRSTNVENKKWWMFGGSFIVLLGLVGLFFFIQLNRVIPATLTADRAHWAFYLSLEDYEPRLKTMTVEDGGFGSPPSDAYRVSSNRVFVRSEPIYETRTVSQTCTGTSSQSNGDGTWTETTYTYDCSYAEQVHVGDDDIWGTRYDYTVDRWESVSPLTKDGWGQETDFPNFTTPEVCLSTRPVYGCVRAPNDPELTFTIHFYYYDDEVRQDVTRSMDLLVWEGFFLGEDYPAVLNGFGEIRAIQTIDPEYGELMGE
jgi:hypothetical protein